MTLYEVAEQLDSFPDDQIIYAVGYYEGWGPDTFAMVRVSPEDGRIRQVFDGIEMCYVLEVNLAKEAVEVYQESHRISAPSTEQKLQAIIYYAENDAYLPRDDEVRRSYTVIPKYSRAKYR